MPEILDPDGDLFNYTYTYQGVIEFIERVDSRLTIEPKSDSDVGNYKIKIELVDFNQKPKKNIYYLTISVLSSDAGEEYIATSGISESLSFSIV